MKLLYAGVHNVMPTHSMANAASTELSPMISGTGTDIIIIMIIFRVQVWGVYGALTNDIRFANRVIFRVQIPILYWFFV
jgi:hypothetical protein